MEFRNYVDDLISGPYNAPTATIISISICILSSLGAALLGVKAFAVPLIALAIFLALRYRNFLFYLFLATLPVVNFIFGGIPVYSYGLVFLIIFLWFCRKIFLNERIHNSKPLVTLIMVFLCAVLISGLKGGLTKDEILVFIRFPIFFALVLVLYDTYDTKDTLKIFISATIPIIASAYFLISIYVSAGGMMQALELFRHKPAGFFTNSNVFAGTIIAIAPFWLALAWWLRSGYAKLMSIVVSSILVVSLILTNSRAAFVGIFLTLVVFSIWAKKLKYFLALIAAIMIVLFSFPVIRTVAFAGLRIERGASSRGEIWVNSGKIIRDNLWMGVGVGNFQEAYDPYLKTAWEKNFFVSVAHAHNQILSKTVELGIIGFFIMLALYYLPLRSGVRALKKTGSKDHRMVIYGIIGGIIALYGRSIFEASAILGEGGFYPEILFWMMFVMLLKIADRTEGYRGISRTDRDYPMRGARYT